MRFLAILLVLFTARVEAAVLTDCITLVNGAVVTATGTGTIVPLSDVGRIHNIEKMSAILSVTNNSGTTPTLSMSLDTCESDIAGTCRSMGFTFTTCTTGTCSENIDFNASSVNYWSHFRANYTLAGTSPNYTVTLRICHN